ncbi:MAG: MBL fold metallo-hydrolase [Alphaproteobacteria bacterium]|nr:MBL fold metallo-hydrolase [Alphaproteobacteria bacterium]
MNIQFIGATGTVTGSKYLLSSGSQQILVDCGLFQGLKQLRLRNWTHLPFKPSEIKSLLLTHAHIDHSGYIPLLVKHGFRGKIHCSRGTAELCKILLPDSGYLQEEDAHFANRHSTSKHKPALPLYTLKDAEECLKYFHPIDFDHEIDLGKDLTFSLLPAGHILGASMVKIQNGRTKLLFTGDLGRSQDIIMNPPKIVKTTDFLILESTYGNRLHSNTDPKQEIADVINRTIHRGGVIVVPAFAVGRAQSLLYLIHELKKEKKIPDVPVYLDSPMARDVTDLYCDFSREHRLSTSECNLMCREAKIINTSDESRELDFDNTPKVIITASGMATGGRVLHHLIAFISNEKNTVLFTGYQAAGTRGAALTMGAEKIKIYGNYYPVRAEIVLQDSLSAHADYDEILNWLENFQQAPKEVFITHGEPTQSDSLRLKIQERFGWKCRVPEYLETVSLSS